MAKNRLKSDLPIQTGRNLPHSVSSYSPRSSLREVRPVVKLKTTKSRVKKIIFSLLLSLFIGVVLLGVWDARNISSASQKLFGSGSLYNLISGGSLKATGNGRVNVLLVGYSVDDPGHAGASLTDSIILLSMNPSNKSGYMLSIPRDLYVKIPGYDYGKINEAYKDNGIGLLEQIITTNFQTPINYYVLVNYATVKQTVNALGGVTVNIQSTDPRGLFDPNISLADGGPLKLTNGQAQLDGQTALNLTRARGDAEGSYGFAQADFDRTQHQRQVLSAIKQKLNWKLVLNPRTNARVLNAVASNIKTDVTASEARPLFGLFNSIPDSKLQSLSLRSLNSRNYLDSYTTYFGQSALIPSAGIDDYSQINSALSQFN